MILPAAILAIAGSAALLAGPSAHAVSGGDLGVLPKGNYVCEIPGDAGDPGIAGGRHQPESDFSVIGDSSYRSNQVRGVYLLTGDRVLMTSGRLQGRRFRRVESSFLREQKPDGSDGELRCISSVQAIGIDPPEGRRCKAQRPQDAAGTGLAQTHAGDNRRRDGEGHAQDPIATC